MTNEPTKEDLDQVPVFLEAIRAVAPLCEKAAEKEFRNAVLEEAAKVADDIHWQLPFYATQELNDVSDDAAESVREQIASAIRALKSGDGK